MIWSDMVLEGKDFFFTLKSILLDEFVAMPLRAYFCKKKKN